MAQYKTKYALGDKAEIQGIPGVVTAIYIREGHRAYEFSFVSAGKPTNCTCEEIELKLRGNNKLGFQGKE